MDISLTNPKKMNKNIEWLNSPEGKKILKAFFTKEEAKEKYIDRRCEWFHNKSLEFRKHFIEKIMKFYDSDKYRDRWWKRYMEPPTSLLWMYYEYADRYGDDAYDMLKNYPDHFMFTTFFKKTPEGFYVERMDGQGSVVSVFTDESFNEFIHKDLSL